MNNALVQLAARRLRGGEGHFIEDLHRVCSYVNIPEGQIAERLAVMLEKTPNCVFQSLDQWAEVMEVLTRPGNEPHVYLPGANGVAVSGLQSGNYTAGDGSTGYSANDGVAGLVLDGMGSLGAEVFTSYSRNSTVETGTSGFPAVCTASAISSVVGIYKAGVANTPYRCSIAWSGNTAGKYVFVGGGTAVVTVSSAVSGSAEFTVAPSIPNLYVYFAASAAGQSISIDSFSAKPITGIHATQSTTSAKPAERRGLYNLLTYSQDLTNAVWITANWTNAVSDIADPFGGTAGRKLTATATPATLDRADKVATSTTHTFAFVFKPGTYTTPSFLIRNNTTATSLTSATYTSNGSGSNAYGTWEFADFGSNGWKICRITCTSGFTIGDTLGLYFGATGAVTNGTYFYVYAGLLISGSASVAQILAEGGIPLTTSAAASNAGAGKYSWQFDGTNDSLALVGVNTGAQGVMIGAFRPNNAHFGAVICSGGDGLGNPGCGIGVDSNSRASFLFGDGTTTNQRINSGATTIVGAAHVISAVWGTSSQKLRVDGSQVGSSAVSVVPVSSGGISIGRINASADYFSGAVGPLIFINGTVSDADLLTLERWVASLTPGGPVF